MTEPFVHLPVMAEEITNLFSTVPEGVVLDATLGGGGHAERLLERYGHLRVLGLDRDEVALSAARRRLARFGDRLMVHHCRFDRLQDAMEAFSVDSLSGAVFDLGVSSPQLDETARGFSYRQEAALDMRMDRSQSWTAADVVNGYPVEQLTRVLQQYGDERFARRISNAIVASRPIETTTELAAIVVAAIPAAARRTGGHPAKRTFQAIRIEVNGELEVLAPALDTAISRTATGGRVAVLSYHSGEDRIVKQRMRLAVTGGCECPPELPCVCDAVQTVRIVRGVPRTPSAAEQEGNRRASSARLRVVERIEDTPRRGTVG
ncbi:MAG TPA: 16S rRNA (cytosine(1402)-N(4))-methyltransferase RsmH [Ilumatobacteraceae bacterium]|nr:16S rRNA (cytosine(1402)-N(4))-methyltransferase RsmH [Ilumatobacteraceae bacterium]